MSPCGEERLRLFGSIEHEELVELEEDEYAIVKDIREMEKP